MHEEISMLSSDGLSFAIFKGVKIEHYSLDLYKELLNELKGLSKAKEGESSLSKLGNQFIEEIENDIQKISKIVEDQKNRIQEMRNLVNMINGNME